MNISYVHPGKAWLQFQHRWYLLDTRDGPLRDWEIGVALFEIAADEVEFEASADARLFLRSIWFDDTNGGFILHYELLVSHTVSQPDAHALLERTERAIADAHDVVGWHGQCPSTTVDLRRVSFYSDHYDDQSNDSWGSATAEPHAHPHAAF